MATNEGGQTYCLRWNNHRTNLAQILQTLGHADCSDNNTASGDDNNHARTSSIADCTLRVDGGFEFRAHRVVLAASSPYLRAALSGASISASDYGSVVLVVPGVARDEMRALLEYMYTGEVRVARAEIARVMRIAEQLEVKGLFDMRDSRLRFDGTSGDTERAPSPDITTTTTSSGETAVQLHRDREEQLHTAAAAAGAGDMDDSFETDSMEGQHIRHGGDRSRLPNEAGCLSPYETVYPRSPPESVAPLTAAWPGSAISQTSPPSYARALSAAYGACADMNPLKRKKLHSMLTSSSTTNQRDGILHERYRKHQEQQLQDTPILRNVLAQHAPDSSQQTMPVALCRPRDMRTASDGSTDADRPMRGDESPYTDKSYDDEPHHNHHGNNQQHDNNNHHGQQQPVATTINNHINHNSTSPSLLYASQHALMTSPYHKSTNGNSGGQPLYGGPQPQRDNNNHQPSSGGGGGGGGGAGGQNQQQQKPEWKRYKQYSRNDIMCAIECVRNGMSALQASRKYNVPSRTLYDKVKKMGITTSRPMNRSFKRGNSLSPATIPYNMSGSSSGFAGQYDGEDQPPQHPAAALLDVKFLQQALEGRGGAELAGREALHAMAIAAAAHAAASGLSASPGNHGNARSPSPVLKFTHRLIHNNHDMDDDGANHINNHRLGNHLNHLNNHQQQLAPVLKSEPMDNDMDNDTDDMDNEVEDLSVGRKQTPCEPLEPSMGFQPVESPPVQQTGVIVQALGKPTNGEEGVVERG